MSEPTTGAIKRWKAMSKVNHLNNRAKIDYMFNASTGLGGERDKATHVEWCYEYPLSQTLSIMHATDDISARICEMIPRDALSKPFKLESPDDLPWRTDQADPLANWLRTRKVFKHFRSAAIKSRMMGGAGIILLIDDGKKLFEAVNFDNIKSVRLGSVRDRWELTPMTWFQDASDPRFDTPETYMLNPRSSHGVVHGSSQMIHADRLLRFNGFELASDLQAVNSWWGGSYLWRAKTRIERLIGSEQSMSLIMQEYKRDVILFNELAELLSSDDGDSDLIARAAQVRLAEGLLGVTVLDAKDRFETRTIGVQGLGELYDRFKTAVSQVAETPQSMLFGEAAGGISSEDKVGRVAYGGTIATHQAEVLNPPLEQLLHLAFLSDDGPTKGVAAEGWIAVWPPYEEASEAEEAATSKVWAEGDAINIEHGIYDKGDVQTARFSIGASNKVIVDMEDRDEDEVIAPPEVEAVELPDEVEAIDPDPVEVIANAGEEDDVQKQALNGAQTNALVTIATSANAGDISPEQGAAIITESFPIDHATALVIATPPTSTTPTEVEGREDPEEGKADAHASIVTKMDAGYDDTVEMVIICNKQGAADLMPLLRSLKQLADDGASRPIELINSTGAPMGSYYLDGDGPSKITSITSERNDFDDDAISNFTEPSSGEGWRVEVECNLYTAGELIPILNMCKLLSRVRTTARFMITSYDKYEYEMPHLFNASDGSIVANIMLFGDDEQYSDRNSEAVRKLDAAGFTIHKKDQVAETARISQEQLIDEDGRSVMIAAYPPPAWSQQIIDMGLTDDEVSKLHLTLIYLGPISEPAIEMIEPVVRDAIAGMSALEMSVTGPAIFNAHDECLVLLLGGFGIAAMRTRIFNALDNMGLMTPQKYDFIPHLTLQYAEAGDLDERLAQARTASFGPFTLSDLRVVSHDDTIATMRLGDDDI